MSYSLSLCNHKRVSWKACGPLAGEILSEMARISGWSVDTGVTETDIITYLHDGAPPDGEKIILPWNFLFKSGVHITHSPGREIHFYLSAPQYTPRQLLFLRRLLSLLPLAHVVGDDAVLVHTALATNSEDGRGTLFCGDSGAGKSTTIERLPESWQKHCDDALLLIRRPEGYFAHVLPTWTKWFRHLPPVDYPGEIPIPVHQLYLLNQSSEDSVEELPLTQQILGASRSMIFFHYVFETGMPCEGLKRLKVKSLDFSREFCREMPVRKLNATLHGEFWKQLN